MKNLFDLIKSEKSQLLLQKAFAATAFILLCIPAFNMTGMIVKPILFCIIGSAVICTSALFSKYSVRVVSDGLLVLMLFWLIFALLKQLSLQTEAGFVFKWIYFFYYDKLLVLGTVWLTAVIFFLIRRLIIKNVSADYKMFFKKSGLAFVIFYCFLLVFSFVLLRLEKGEHPLNLQPLSTIKDYIAQWESIPYEVFMMVCGNLFYFTPLGYIFVVKLRNKRKISKCLTFVFFPVVAFSLLELSQYVFQNGCCEFDDMMMNSVGFWFGCILCFATDKLAKSISKGRCITFWE